MNKYPEADKIMWRVFQWAYDNDIEVRLSKRRDYGLSDGYPELRFSRNGKHVLQGFYPATDLTGKLESIWQNIALELCVEPLNLDDLND